MNDMHDGAPGTDPSVDPSIDLPPQLAAALRDIPPADDPVRDAHISAALDEVAAAPRTTVTQIGARRASFLATAAAAIALLGGAAGWMLHSPAEKEPFSAEQALVAENGQWSPYTTVPDAGTTKYATSGADDPLAGDSPAASPDLAGDVPAKGAPARSCAMSLVAGAVIIGDITTDGNSYLVVQLGKKVTLYSNEDCSVFVTYDLP